MSILCVVLIIDEQQVLYLNVVFFYYFLLFCINLLNIDGWSWWKFSRKFEVDLLRNVSWPCLLSNKCSINSQFYSKFLVLRTSLKRLIYYFERDEKVSYLKGGHEQVGYWKGDMYKWVTYLKGTWRGGLMKSGHGQVC